MRSPDTLTELLTALGQLLADQGSHVRLLVVGGAALSLAARIPIRPTRDVDVLARIATEEPNGPVLLPPNDLPATFYDAVRTVARDFGVEEDWLNIAVAEQWREGLPPSAADDLVWRHFDGLELALAGRRTLIHLKLFAAVDQGPASVHYQDLIQLNPTDRELDEAAPWVAKQDASEVFPRLVEEAVSRVRTELGRDSEERD